MTDPRDPRGLAADAPLLAAWLRFMAAEVTPFTIPGHKQRTDLVGSVVSGDVPLHAGLDTMGLTNNLLRDAESRAARLWSADWCRFSVGGSTHGNQALALAVARPGAKVIVSRTLHRSLLLGLVLAGLEPVWVRPGLDPETGLPTSVPAEAVSRALREHPDARAVFLGDPSYVGTISPLGEIADAAHAHAVPLLVDAAWAPHFGLSTAFPPHALQLGADAMVISAHKTLPAWSQGALVLARRGLLDEDRLERGFEATHTTSPAGAILASIDASRALFERDGEALGHRLVALVNSARDRLDAVPGVRALRSVEPAKLVVQLPGSGASGRAVEADLLTHGLPVELADRDTLVAIVTVSDTEETVSRLVDVMVRAVEKHRGEPRHPAVPAQWRVTPSLIIPPREAFFAPHETVPATEAPGRISAELIAPYPPGIPVLAPGELITAEAVEALQLARAEGGRIAYAADATLRTFQVVSRP